ncbi:hypothetical protein IWW39_001130 [Coemansia spiralis]|uniref:TRF2-interacting telomeric protein/Rap1 C-terminal domain-containing protein n=2 Tax=Coemansia TaxID=4863 RepID=A0A9W8GLC5_9FUNG|nr:hypothetical protein IWW39_001130 [Coemansia spiralis]
MLDTEDFELVDVESDESESESGEEEESESDVVVVQGRSAPRAESGSQSEDSADDSEGASSSQQTVETPERQQQQRRQSRLSLTPADSALGDIRYLYADDDELDPDDRYVDIMLSSQSRSIEDLVVVTDPSPDPQFNKSADISDNDFRVKTQLDASARDPREMLDLVLTDSPVDSLANSPVRGASHSQQPCTSGASDLLQREYEQEESEEINPALRTPSPQPPPAKQASSSIPQQTPSRSVFSRIKSLFLASGSSNGSPTPSTRGKSPSSFRLKSQSPARPAALTTQYSQESRASSSLSMEGTPERSTSPELVMPPTQIPMSPAFTYLQLPENAAQVPASSDAETSLPRRVNGLGLVAPSDEENQDPNPLLGSRMLRSESPELSSLPATSSKSRVATSNGAKAKPPTPYPTASFREEEEPAPPSTAPTSAPVAAWTGLGKRRRTPDKNSGYGRRPLPVLVGNDDDSELSSPEMAGQSLFLSQQQAPPAASKTQSMDSLLATPAGKRVRMRAVPFSPSKRIRMSILESPEAISATSANVLRSASATRALESATISVTEASPTTPMTAELARLSELSRLSHIAATSRVNGHSGKTQLPSPAPTSGIADTTTDNAAHQEAQASPESIRPRVTTMATDTSLSTVPTPVIGSPSRHDGGLAESVVVAAAPSSGPLVISELFANKESVTGLQIVVPLDDPYPELVPSSDDSDANKAAPTNAEHTSARENGELKDGEAIPGSSDAPPSQPALGSPSHHSDDLGNVSDAGRNGTMDVVGSDAENDADDDSSDVEEANAPSDYADPVVVQEDEKEPSHRSELLNDSQHGSDPVVGGEDYWRIEDGEEPVKMGLWRTPQNLSRPANSRPATSHIFKSPARMANSNGRPSPGAISKSQPRATRSRRASTARIVTTCQRLLTLHRLGDDGGGLGFKLGDSLLGSRALLGANAPEASRLSPHGASSASSPARRAQFSGAMRVFGDSVPDMNDSERLAYLRKLKGLMVGTSLTPKQAMATLYRCTGDWVIARKFIISGEASVPGGRVWSAEDDQALQEGMDLDKMEELRLQKGNVEVYRRLQFLNTFHGPSE